ncbi:MAG TPA: carboxypeptidase regulatory-like domain-containing protein [Planctomycetota bacterium]
MKPILLTLPFLALLGSRGLSIGPATAAPGDEPGTVRGKAAFQGEAPRRRKVDMGSDPACHALHEAEPLRDESILVDDKGGLANVFVYVSKGIDGKFTPPTEPAVLDQKGCCYVPHVLGMQVGQKLVIRNSDPVTHNVHSFAKKNKAFNQSQQSGGKELEHVFDKEEVLMQIKCDIHGWMSTYVGVVEHPFFAVTRADGSFEIPKLPPGEYTLTAKHEALGTQKTTLTVAAGGTVETSFSFAEQ